MIDLEESLDRPLLCPRLCASLGSSVVPLSLGSISGRSVSFVLAARMWRVKRFSGESRGSEGVECCRRWHDFGSGCGDLDGVRTVEPFHTSISIHRQPFSST